uniref:Reverse transcriptase domain-containing protein n=1 Tax=Knipowitschia caucasica TaxID=637954 RepID=A0AAV2JTG5_KNICA
MEDKSLPKLSWPNPGFHTPTLGKRGAQQAPSSLQVVKRPRWEPPRRLSTPPPQLPQGAINEGLRRALFPKTKPLESILFMSYMEKIVGLPELTKGRLPSHVWVGLRAPWRAPSPCPLCAANLSSLGLAGAHFRKTHGARRILLLCAKCGTSSFKTSSMTGHASKCKIGREMKKDGGDFACALCAKHLKTQRGLSQHLRLAHLGAYLEMGRKSKGPLLLRPPGPGLSNLLEKLNTPLMNVPRVNELVHVMRANWGPPGQTTRVGINREARNLVIKFRSKLGLTKFTGQSKIQNAPRLPRNIKEAYKLTQDLWWRDPCKAAQLILDGAPPNCVLPRATIEETYKQIWCGRDDRFKSLAGFGKLPVANNNEFHSVVTGLEVVRTLKRMAKKSCPGPDGLRRSQLLLLDRKGLKLAKLFNDWLRSGMIPKVFKASKTTLIPKSIEPELCGVVGNWRPLTIGSTVLRVFSNILAARLSNACPVHPRQKGFVNGSGCSENLTVLNGLITLAKKERRELAVVFIDLAKAFDTVSHRLIRETLTRRGVDQLVVKVIMDGYRGCSSSIRTIEGPTKEIPIKLGVKQGDPLSPLLFNLALDPLLYALDDVKTGFEFGEDAALAAMAFADDLVLVSGRWEGMRSNLAVLDAFCDRVGLAVNPDKCVAFHIGHKGRKGVLNACPTWTINGQPIRMLNGQEQAKYLGVEIHPWKGICCPPLAPKLESGLVRIDKAGIKPHRRLVVLRSYLLPRLLYVCDHSGLSRAVSPKVGSAAPWWAARVLQGGRGRS